MAFAPQVQHGKLEVGNCLSSRSSKYMVESILGQGTFGTVAACTRLKDMKKVAIKMIKNEGSLMVQAQEEVLSLMKVKKLDPDKCNIVRWYSCFMEKEHVCLEFEQLDRSLRDFMMQRDYRPLPLMEIRPIVQQVANALDHLKSVGITHADLKLENVMLVNHECEPYRVKLIDFGSACDASGDMVGSCIQTLRYRSPEILLGLPFTEAIDVWSLGCLAAILYLGSPLFPGKNEYDMMRFIVETQGQPPDSLLSLGFKTQDFFNKFRKSKTSFWKLKPPELYQRERGIQQMETRTRDIKFLDDILHIQSTFLMDQADTTAELADVQMFVTMLKEMLHVDAAKRITPRQVMQHAFISMDHIVSLHSTCSYTRSCFDIMKVCQQNLASGSEKAVHRPLQQPTCSTTDPIQQNLPPPPAKEPSLSHSPSVNPHSGSNALNTSPVKSGIKRKFDHEDKTMDETSHPSKKFKSLREEHPGPSNASHSHDQIKYSLASTDARGNLAQPSHHNVINICHQKQPDQCCTRPGVKRKIPDGVDDVECQHTNFDQKRKRFCQSYAAQSTSDTSSQTHGYVSPQVENTIGQEKDIDLER